MSVLRSYDPNFHRRRLRELLLDLPSDRRGEFDVPHSFDTDALLDVARVAIGRIPLEWRDVHDDLLACTGIVTALLGDEHEALALFERGVLEAEDDLGRGRFRFLIGHYVHQRAGRTRAAWRELERAVALIPANRPLHHEVQLAIGHNARVVGDHGYAVRAYETVLGTAREFDPHARLGLSNVRADRGEMDEARELADAAVRGFEAVGERLGVLTAEAHLATLALASGDPAGARSALERVVSERERTHDVMRLAKSYNNLAVACRRLGDHDDACRYLSRAIRTNEGLGRSRLLAANYHNLGRTLLEAGDEEAALSAFERAIFIAHRVGSTEREFESIAEVVTLLAGRPGREKIVRDLIARGGVLTDSEGAALSHEALIAFARASLQEVDRVDALAGSPVVRGGWPISLGTAAGRERMGRLVAMETVGVGITAVRRRLHDSFRYRGAPAVEKIAQFLLSFAGELFQNSDYAQEFDLSHDVAKRQLRTLCQVGVLELIGQRKAARYALSFQRRADEAS